MSANVSWAMAQRLLCSRLRRWCSLRLADDSFVAFYRDIRAAGARGFVLVQLAYRDAIAQLQLSFFGQCAAHVCMCVRVCACVCVCVRVCACVRVDNIALPVSTLAFAGGDTRTRRAVKLSLQAAIYMSKQR